MGRKSTRANKTAYQLSREAAGLTRERAGELMEFVSDDRIEKIEAGKSLPHPEEVLAMSDCYKDARLCNYFCSHECPIGQEYVPEVKVKALSQVTLEMLATLNVLQQEKDRLIEITVDGAISEDEIPDFLSIQDNLEKLALAIESLKLWVSHAIAEGEVDRSLLERDI